MIYNLTKRTHVAKNPVFADTFYLRVRGMIGRNFQDFDGMVFEHCNCIHTFFMSVTLDVIFIDGNNNVCDLRENAHPWHPVIRSRKAVTVIELPQGQIRKSGTQTGDKVNLREELSKAEQQKLKKKLLHGVKTAVTSRFRTDCKK